MKRNRTFKSIITVLIVLSVVLFINVLIQRKFITTYTYTELEYRGYTAQDVSEIEIKHSYLNWILSYNEWRISVEFEKIPDVLFWFTYRDNTIVFQGVSSDPMLDKEAILIYSERFKNGTLLMNDYTTIPAVMINGQVYYRMNIGILGVEKDWTPEGVIQSQVSPDQYPTEHEQSNFGTGYEYELADGLYGVFVKKDDKVELYQLKDKGEFYYEDLVFEKAALSDKEFEWLSGYYLADEENRTIMRMPEGLLEKGIPVVNYRQ